MAKVVLITGASSGIGEALAWEFASRTYKLVLTARRMDRLEALSNALRSQYPKIEILCCECDVRDRASTDLAVHESLKRFGQLDTVIANAGYGVAGRMEKLSVEDFRQQFETNVFGVLNTVYSSLESLKASRGQLVLMGSVNSYVSEPKKAPYCMSKFAVRALADSLYWELKPAGVAVTLICPGLVESEIRKVRNDGTLDTDAVDPAPQKLIMPAKQAAREMAAAIVSRKREKIITRHGKIAVFLQRHFPAALTPLFKGGKSVSRRQIK